MMHSHQQRPRLCVRVNSSVHGIARSKFNWSDFVVVSVVLCAFVVNSAKSQPSAAESNNAVTSSLAVGRWAIIVGVSQHQHSELNLKFAHRDAEALYELIQKPTAGGFPKDNILKLVNEQATTGNVTKALRTFLKKPAQEDIVLLYFSGHGTPDSDRPDHVYFVTHDTDPQDISGTALPMREVEWCLTNYLNAKRVILLADTCHSGALGGGGRRSLEPVARAQVSNYLTLLAKSNPGTAMLMSAEPTEVSLEGEEWGGGHGAFTHYLLEAMNGKADSGNPDGVVTVGEMFDYVQQQVKTATKDRQHPLLGPKGFDRGFPIAITAGISGRLHFDLGTRLYEVGRKLEEKRLLKSAADHLRYAKDFLVGEPKDQLRALRLRGLAQLAAGEPEAAIESLEEARQSVESNEQPDLAFYLGMAHAIRKREKPADKQPDYVKAVELLTSFVKSAPNHENTAWARQTIERLGSDRKSAGKCFVLLVGTNEYGNGQHKLRGPENDVDLMAKVLSTHPLFTGATITILKGKDATYSNIVEKLDALKQTTQKRDKLLVYFSGLSSSHGSDFIYCRDTSFAKGAPTNAITGGQLHRALEEMPAGVWLILDTFCNVDFADLATRSKKYTVFFGCSRGEMSNEDQGNGAFTKSLAPTLERLSDGFPNQRLVTESKVTGQTPMLIGDPDKHFLETELSPTNWFQLGYRWQYPEMTRSVLKSRVEEVLAPDFTPLAALYLPLANALIDRGEYPLAEQLLEKQSQSAGDSPNPDALCAKARLRVRTGKYEEAANLLSDWTMAAQLPPESLEAAQTAIRQIKDFAVAPAAPCALLVGIDDYVSETVEDLQGAVTDVRAVKQRLHEKFGFALQDITVLENHQAKRETVVSEFRKLVERSKHSPALFYFAGNGSLDRKYKPTLLSADARTENVADISSEELASLCKPDTHNLLTILDCGWANRGPSPNVHLANDRFSAPDPRLFPERDDRAIGPVRPKVAIEIQIGRHTICRSLRNVALQEIPAEVANVPLVSGTAQATVHGTLTHALLSCLKEDGAPIETYGQWVEAAKTKMGAESAIVAHASVDPNELVFSNGVAMQRVETALQEIDKRRIRACIELLTRLADDRRDLAGDANIDIGILAAAIQDFDRSLTAFRRALNTIADDRPRLAEIHYHYGRALYESARHDLAVVELRQAVQLDATNNPARYFLGRSIQQLIEQNLVSEAREHLTQYLSNGASLGRRDEVELILNNQLLFMR